jgi:Leucine-rich repeat (LRR) protein
VLLDKVLREQNSNALYRNGIFTLSMPSHELTNLEPLARLSGLRELVLTDNPELSDLRPLAALKNLQHLDVEFTAVQDFSPLYKLNAMQLFFTDATSIECKKSEVTNQPLKKLCTQE